MDAPPSFFPERTRYLGMFQLCHPPSFGESLKTKKIGYRETSNRHRFLPNRRGMKKRIPAKCFYDKHFAGIRVLGGATIKSG